MLETQKVVSLFSLFTDLEGAALEPWVGFCEAACGYFAARLRPGVDITTHMEALCMAAAGVAYADFLTVYNAAGQSDEVRVGDISLKNSESTAQRGNAAEIRSYFLGGVAHLLLSECPTLLATGGDSHE